MLPPTATRVPRHTSPRVNRAIQSRTAARLEQYRDAPPSEIDRRLTELDHEWDVERTLQANFAGVNLLGLALGALVDRRWLLLPAAACAFMVQHSVQGWCPPLAVIRRLGVRTASEIDAERRALLRLRAAR